MSSAMRLHCPQCDKSVQAENINMQRLVALCDDCSIVFDVNHQRPKAKRRKILRPEPLRILSEDPLHLAFRTNFRLDKSESFITSAILSGVFSLLALMMSSFYIQAEIPIFLPLMFLLMSGAALYSLATNVYNKTNIRLDSEAIHVSRQPLPSLTRAWKISLDGIDSFIAEETVASQREGYDTSRYHVWALAESGQRRLVCGDLIEDYADYIASQLNRRLLHDNDASVGRLSDSILAESITLEDSDKPSNASDILR